MKTLYLDCGMGAAGDMLAAALLELLPDRTEFMAELNRLGIPDITFSCESSEKCGIRGTHITVTVRGEEESESMHDHCHTHAHEHDHDHDHAHSHTHEHAHHHSGMHEIEHIVEALPVSEKVRADILSVFSLIAEAESQVHGVPVSDIHFHEVGTMDAVADITAVCLLMERLSPDRIVASPVHVGSGQVRCAHGILPVPAPATAHILRGVPTYGGEIQSELCTPTGAALLKHFAADFAPMPVMCVRQIGYGMGTKDFSAANCLRAMLGEDANHAETVTELCCNVDDMTPEEIGFAMEELLSAGALDVYTLPIGMKKSRPAVMLCVLCLPAEREELRRLLFRHTTTLGIREHDFRRHTLTRTVDRIESAFGSVRVKRAAGCGVSREKIEYDDLAAVARENGLSLREAAAALDIS